MCLRNRLMCALCVLAIAAQTWCLNADEPSPHVPPELIVERFAIGTDGDAVYLPVTIAGRTYSFLLDTGATWTAIDKSLLPADAPAEMRKGRSATKDEITFEVCDAPIAQVGQINLRDSVDRVVRLDLTQMRQISGDDFFGVLGLDFLSHHIVRVDFDRGECLLLNRVPPGAGQKLQMYQVDGLPGVKARTLGGAVEYFAIDTGGIGSRVSGAITQSLYDRLAQHRSIRYVSSALQRDISGTVAAKFSQANGLEIGTLRINGPVFSVGSVSNLLGAGFMSRFIATFDFPAGCLYLRPGKAFDAADTWDRSGLHIIRRDGKALVYSVDKGSAADASGLREGDEILEVGNLEAADSRLMNLRELLCEAGTAIKVVYRRGGKTSESPLHLGNAISHNPVIVRFPPKAKIERRRFGARRAPYDARRWRLTAWRPVHRSSPRGRCSGLAGG